jgi:glutaredoxin-like protein NrdH
VKTIRLYSKPRCVQCTATKRWLDKRGIEYQTVDVSQSPDDLAAIKALGYMSAPVVIISNGDPETDIHWAGFDVNHLARYCTEAAA